MEMQELIKLQKETERINKKVFNTIVELTLEKFDFATEGDTGFIIDLLKEDKPFNLFLFYPIDGLCLTKSLCYMPLSKRFIAKSKNNDLITFSERETLNSHDLFDIARFLIQYKKEK